MKQTVYRDDFHRAFQELRPGKFSPATLDVLFDYYDELDANYELDVTAICCEWTEYTKEELLSTFNGKDEDVQMSVEDGDISLVLERINLNHEVLCVNLGERYLVSN